MRIKTASNMRIETAYKITAAGLIEEVVPSDGRCFKIHEVYSITDSSMVQALDLPNARVMLVDEDGKMKGRTVNKVATSLSGVGRFCDFIVGDVLVCPRSMFS